MKNIYLQFNEYMNIYIYTYIYIFYIYIYIFETKQYEQCVTYRD